MTMTLAPGQAVDKILALRSYVDRVEPTLGSQILRRKMAGWLEIGRFFQTKPFAGVLKIYVTSFFLRYLFHLQASVRTANVQLVGCSSIWP